MIVSRRTWIPDLESFFEPSEKEVTTKLSTAVEVNRHLNSLSQPPNELVLQRNLCGQIGWLLEYRGLVQMVQSREFEKVIKSQCVLRSTHCSNSLHPWRPGREGHTAIQRI